MQLKLIIILIIIVVGCLAHRKDGFSDKRKHRKQRPDTHYSTRADSESFELDSGEGPAAKSEEDSGSVAASKHTKRKYYYGGHYGMAWV